MSKIAALLYDRLNLHEVRMLAEAGHTDEYMARFFCIPISTWESWKKTHPEFKQHLLDWKAVADSLVQAALFQRATGMEYIEYEDILRRDGTIERLEKKRILPADVGACSLWLRNRRGNEWKDKTEKEVSGKVDHEHRHIQMSDDEAADRLAQLIKSQENRINQLEFGADLEKALQ